MKTFVTELEEHQAMIVCLAEQADAIEAAGALLIATLKQGGKILLCGNGGSAADCQHIAAELVVRYEKKRQAMAAIALTTDSSILTAHANDFDFEPTINACSSVSFIFIFIARAALKFCPTLAYARDLRLLWVRASF